MKAIDFIRGYCEADQSTQELIALLLEACARDEKRVLPIVRAWNETEEHSPEELRRMLEGEI